MIVLSGQEVREDWQLLWEGWWMVALRVPVM